MPPDWVGDRSSFAGREVRPGIQIFPRLRHDRAALCPQAVERAEDSDGPQTRCCFRDEYNKDIAELLWDGSKHFHALEQLRDQHECIVTEQGKVSHRKTIGGRGGVRGKLACGTTDGVRGKGRETGSLGQCGSVDRAGFLRLPQFLEFLLLSSEHGRVCNLRGILDTVNLLYRVRNRCFRESMGFPCASFKCSNNPLTPSGSCFNRILLERCVNTLACIDFPFIQLGRELHPSFLQLGFLHLLEMFLFTLTRGHILP